VKNYVERGVSIVDMEIGWLDRLRAELEPNIKPAVATLVHLMTNSSRDQVREKAASKILGLYAQATTDAAKLKLQSKQSDDDDDADKFRVLVVTPDQLGEASQLLAADYQAQRALAKDAS
jgi:alkanesulfonate monooxygenase SsuD/methylene tetrahydromethanopterin reductase-like flavin-dependent oxidoreductase (luciferase family)